MKKRLLTSIACAAVLTSTVLPAANYVVQPQSQKVSAATLDQNAFLKKAAKQAEKAAKKYGTYPSVMIAQAIVESGWGQSGLAVNTNNLFGVKADASWVEPTYSARTREEKNGKSYYINAKLENIILLKNHSKIMVRSCVKAYPGNHYATRVLGLKMPTLTLKQLSLLLELMRQPATMMLPLIPELPATIWTSTIQWFLEPLRTTQ